MTINVTVPQYTIDVDGGIPIPGPPGPPGPVYAFPPGQPGQVWTVLPNGTMGWTTPAPAAPTLPVSAFSMASTAQVGAAVTLTDASTGNPSSWSWTFTGGITARSGQGPHIVSFPAAGSYTVTLQVSNAAGSHSSSQQITITAAPVVLVPGEVIFTTTGATFSPRIELVDNATQTVSWVDGADAPMSPATGLQPTFNFGSAATRTVKMRIPDGSEVRVLNIGYNFGDDSPGFDVPAASYQHTAQQVTAVTGMPSLPNLRYFLAANGPIAGHLDFTGCSQLQNIECFRSQVVSVNLTGCTSLIRFCFEDCPLSGTVDIDINPCAATLRDIRAARSGGGPLRFATLVADVPNLWHFCVRERSLTNPPPLSRFPMLGEYWAWGCQGLPSALAPRGSARLDMRVNYGAGVTSYNDSARSNTNTNSAVDLSHSGVSSVTLHNGSRYGYLDFSGNPGITTGTVDHILATVNGWGTSNGTLNLAGCGQPSAAAPSVIAALQGRGWTVTTETPLAGAPPAPTAGFTVTPASPQATVPATFTSTSTYAEAWTWNFGADATPATANTVGPHSVTYAIAGVKTVTLTVSNATGSDPETQNVTVQAAPSGGDLFTDYFNRVAGDIAALGNGWNSAGTGATASADGTDLLYVAAGHFGRLATPTTVTLPANYGVEVVAPRSTWTGNYGGFFARHTAADNFGVKFFTVSSGAEWVIGTPSAWDTNNSLMTMTGGFPAGWTGAGDHTVRIEVNGSRVDVYADGQHVGYRDAMGAWCNAGITGTGVGFCGDTGGGARIYHSIRVYPLP